MKKQLSLLFISLLLFSACGDDEDEIDQLHFSFKNEASLIGKLTSYIKSASPGTIMSQYTTDTTLYFLYDESTTLGDLELFYNLESKKCNGVGIYSYTETLTASYSMILQADSELGTAYGYVLVYTDSESNADTTFFDTLSDMQAYISANSIAATNITYLAGYYPTDEYDYYAGGLTDESTSTYWPFTEIYPKDGSKKSAPSSAINDHIFENIKSRVSSR
jgi:hypothetical protein